MLLSQTIRFFSISCLLSFPLLGLTAINPAQAQETLSPEELEMEDETTPNSSSAVTRRDGLLSMQGGNRLMNEASQAIQTGDYDLASQRLKEARQVFNQLSNFYQQLAGSFAGIDNRVADSQRSQALETAQKRDDATYQLALVHRSQDQPELAVPLLIQIVRSQNPTTDLGGKAYQQLFELGFVTSPYPSSPGNPSPSN